MALKAFLVEKQFVIALANRIFRGGRDRIAFRSPLLKSDLLAVDGGFRVASAIGPGTYHRERKALVGGDRAADEEMPTAGDLNQALQACGAIPPRNLTEFLGKLDAIERDASRAKSLALAVDTNVAYNRLFSRHLDHVRDMSGCFRLLLSRGVRDEVDSRIRGKAGRETLGRLYSARHLLPFLDQLGNRNSLGTRRGKLAQNEIDYLIARHSPIEATCGTFRGDKEAFDREIAEGYAALAEHQRLEAYMVTFDQNMGTHAKNAGLRALMLIPPDAENIRGASVERAFPALVHDLAVLFGALIIEPFGIRVWGEWGGKTSEDYERERLRLEIDFALPQFEAFERDVHIGQMLLKEAAGWAK